MRRLETAIVVANGLVFVSDCHKSFAKSIVLVFPDNFHTLCIHHLSLNLTTKFNNDNVRANFMLAMKACRLVKQKGFCLISWGNMATKI